MPPESTLAAVQRDLRRRFEQAGIETAALDARLLLMHALAIDQVSLVSDSMRTLSADELTRVDALAQRRLAGETVARIVGEREFYGRPFAVTADTLEPRPDTETLIDAALATCAARAPTRILDLGTGTGVLLVTLLASFPGATGVAVDLSAAALAVAAKNAARHGVADRARFVVSDWFSAIKGTFDLIVSNPPYIPDGAMGALPREVREGDPRRALAGGFDGLDAYRAIARGALAHLAEGGAVLVEVGQGQATDVVAIFAEAGLVPRDVPPRPINDLAGIERVLAFGRR